MTRSAPASPMALEAWPAGAMQRPAWLPWWVCLVGLILLSGQRAALATSAASAMPAVSAEQAAARPDIVVLVADDWGFSDMGAFGGEIATPHLDALALKGTRFTNFHVAASCSPTRAMLLTGVSHHRAGHGNLRETMPRAHLGRPGYQATLAPTVLTFATLLKDAGYRTYIAGKWNVGHEPENLPDRRGFDRSLVLGDTGSDNFDPQQRYLPHSARVSWFEDGRPARMPASFYSSTFFVDRIIEHIGRGPADGAPFLAYVGFQANHVPLQAPPGFLQRQRGRYDTGWQALREARRDRLAALGLMPPGVALAPVPGARPWASLDAEERRYQARLMEVYAAMAEAMDHEVGRLVAHLKAIGRFERTVFVFLSDNGPEGSDYRQADLWLRTQYSRDLDRLGGPGAYAVPGPGWAGATASPLAGFKFYAAEGGVRVPMFISGAPGAKPGAVHAGLTHVTDILPTLLGLAQVPLPGAQYRGRSVEPTSGRSLLPVLSDPAATLRGPDEVLGYELSGNKALYQGDLKLVLNLPPVGDGRWQLYDLRADPGETRDLSAQRPQDVARMRTAWEAWAQAQGVLEMPEGYSHTRQVVINTFLNYWIPSYWPHAALLASALIVLAGWRWWRRAARA